MHNYPKFSLQWTLLCVYMSMYPPKCSHTWITWINCSDYIWYWSIKRFTECNKATLQNMNISKQIILIQYRTTWITNVSAILCSYTVPQNNANKSFPVLSKVTICLQQHCDSTSRDSIKVLLQWNSTSIYTSWTYSTYHLELALGTFIRQFISACLVCHIYQEKISLNSYSEIHGSRYPMRSNLSSVTAALPRL